MFSPGFGHAPLLKAWSTAMVSSGRTAGPEAWWLLLLRVVAFVASLLGTRPTPLNGIWARSVAGPFIVESRQVKSLQLPLSLIWSWDVVW